MSNPNELYAAMMEADRQRGAIIRAYEARHGVSVASADAARCTPAYRVADAEYKALSGAYRALDGGHHEQAGTLRLARRLFGGR